MPRHIKSSLRVIPTLRDSYFTNNMMDGFDIFGVPPSPIKKGGILASTQATLWV